MIYSLAKINDSLSIINIMKYIIITNSIFRSLSLVERSVRSSLNQEIKAEKVILVDQNEKNLELSPDILNCQDFELQHAVVGSVSAARNKAIIPENIDWIVFCDDDGYLDVDYSRKFHQYVKNNPEIEVIAGSILREDTMDYYSLRHKKGGSLTKFHNSKNLMGSNFAVKAKVFQELNKFDESFGAGATWGSGEETDFCWKAFFGRKKMEYVPEMRVIHVAPFNESIKQGFNKSYRYGIGKGALVTKWIVQNKKSLVFLELFEMFTVPLVQILRGLLTLKLGLIVNNIASLTGRVIGIIKFISFK